MSDCPLAPVEVGDEPWEFAGWGRAERIPDLHDVRLPIRRLDQPHRQTNGRAVMRAAEGLPIGDGSVTCFIGCESAVPSEHAGMARWREALFAFLKRNTSDATAYDRLPPEHVIELGIRVEI